MKLKLTVILTTLVVTTGLLLGASTAQETKVIFDGNNATGIENLEVDTVLYNVEFRYDSAENIYGDPLIFDFPDLEKALAAMNAVIDALNSESAVTTVGPEEDSEYVIAPETNGEYFVNVWYAVYPDSGGPWQIAGGEGVQLRWTSGLYTYADFTQVPVEAEIVPIPRTGQTQSYYPGDDGDLRKGAPWPVPRFSDNGDDTVTDNLTGLIWLQCATCSRTTWHQAMDFISECEDGAACGGTILTDGSKAGDWRLPNRRELESVMDFSRSSPALPAGHPFSYEESGSVMWTSTTYPGYEGLGAWLIDMDSGEVAVGEKTLVRTYWAVRDAIED